MAYRYDDAHNTESNAPDGVVKGIFAGAANTEYVLQICRLDKSVFAEPKSESIKTDKDGVYKKPIPIVECSPTSGVIRKKIYAKYRLLEESEPTEDAEKTIFYKCTKSPDDNN